MGDRCYLTVMTARGRHAHETMDDHELVLATFGDPDYTTLEQDPWDGKPETHVSMGFDEINYGGTDQLMDLATRNPWLVAAFQSGPGAEYGASVGFMLGGRLFDFPAHDNEPVVVIRNRSDLQVAPIHGPYGHNLNLYFDVLDWINDPTRPRPVVSPDLTP